MKCKSFTFVVLIATLFSAFPTLSRAQFWAALPPLKPTEVQSLSFSQDEKFVFYESRESGSSNIYRVPVKGGASQQLTKFTDAPIYRALHMLGRGYLVFMKAKTPTDLDYHIYRIKDDGSDLALDLTPTDVGVVNTIIGESYNGRYLYYTANKESLKKLDCYRYDNEQNISELMLPNDKDYQVLAWTRDQKKLLVKDPTTSAVSLFDIETTERTQLAVASQSGTELHALFSTDNHRLLFLAVDPKSISLSNGTLAGISMEAIATASDEHWDYSPNGKYLIKLLNGAYSMSAADTKQDLGLPTGITSIGVAPKENLIAFVRTDSAGLQKLQLTNIEKKTTVDLATIK